MARIVMGIVISIIFICMLILICITIIKKQDEKEQAIKKQKEDIKKQKEDEERQAKHIQEIAAVSANIQKIEEALADINSEIKVFDLANHSPVVVDIVDVNCVERTRGIFYYIKYVYRNNIVEKKVSFEEYYAAKQTKHITLSTSEQRLALVQIHVNLERALCKEYEKLK